MLKLAQIPHYQRKMEPFKVAAPLAKLTNPYPDAKSVLDVANKGGEQARIALARLWLSEGIPFAFKECPGIYESVRTWLSGWLGITAKEISLTGSARLGESLSPKQAGKPFNEKSDLDIFVVSNVLFEKLRQDFRSWSFDFESGKMLPTNNREADFWRDNNSRGPKLIQRGFLDSKMIPNLPPYATAKNINQATWLLIEKLRITTGAPKAASASVRCYESWEAYVRQTALSLVSQ
jgi:hypothetical protein